MGYDIVVKKYTSEYEDKWDRFVLSESINGTFLQTRRFLNYHAADRFVDCSLLFFNGSTLIAVLPGNYLADEQTLISHQGSTFGGLIINKNSCKISILDCVFQQFEEYIHKNGIKKVILSQTSEIYQKYKSAILDYYYYMMGYVSSAEMGYYIDLETYSDNIIDEYSASRRRDYRYSLKYGFHFRSLESVDAIKVFYKILINNYKKFDTRPVHTLEELLDLYKNRIPENMRFYGVFDEEQMVAGATIFKFDKRVFHTQYLAVSQSDTSRYINEFLYTNIIAEAQEQGFQKVSFGTATLDKGKILNRNLAQYKESYGTNTYINYRYTKIYYDGKN